MNWSILISLMFSVSGRTRQMCTTSSNPGMTRVVSKHFLRSEYTNARVCPCPRRRSPQAPHCEAVEARVEARGIEGVRQEGRPDPPRQGAPPARISLRSCSKNCSELIQSNQHDGINRFLVLVYSKTMRGEMCIASSSWIHSLRAYGIVLCSKFARFPHERHS